MNYLALFENPLDFFVKGGVFMWVLLACSFVTLTVILLRLFALRKGEIAPRLIEKTIAAYQPGERLDQLRRLVIGDDSALARIVEVAIRPYHASSSDLKGIASGIGEALSTTIVGLAIAILSLIAFLSFTRRVETSAVQMESMVTDL